MRKNTDYRIISIQESNFAAETGDDITFFRVDFSPKRKLSSTYFVLVNYSDIQEYWREVNPSLYQYALAIRGNILGYGPKDSKVLAELAQSDIQIEAWVKDYVMANCELYLNEEHQERLRKMAQEQKQTLTAEEAEAARQKEEQLRNSLRELSQHTAKMRSYQVLFDELAEGIDEAIIALVLKKHPYILEAKGNRVRELQYMLVDYTPELTKEILEFLLEIKQEMKGDTA